MATAQVVSATPALHDEKIVEQTVEKLQDEIKNTDDQETTVTAPQPSEEHPPKEPADTTAAPEPETEPKPEPELEPKAEPEPEALGAEVETKVVLKEEEGDQEGKVISPVDQPAKVAPEPCVEEVAVKEAKEPEGEPEAQTEPAEVTKAEAEPAAEPEDVKVLEKEEGGAADDQE